MTDAGLVAIGEVLASVRLGQSAEDLAYRVQWARDALAHGEEWEISVLFSVGETNIPAQIDETGVAFQIRRSQGPQFAAALDDFRAFGEACNRINAIRRGES